MRRGVHMTALKTLREAGGFERVRRVFAGSFAAETRRRKDFCGIRKLQRVESAADALHSDQIGFGEHFGHHFLLVHADTMFAGNGATRLDA